LGTIQAQFLAVLGVGHAEHLHRLHLGVAEQEFLDLARVDVLAAADQHVLGAADDVAVALGVDRGQVAGVHPAVAHRLARAFGVAPVAEHHRVAAHQQFALLAHGQHLALGIDHLGLQHAAGCGPRWTRRSSGSWWRSGRTPARFPSCRRRW
jgi:hypothetical protein